MIGHLCDTLLQVSRVVTTADGYGGVTVSRADMGDIKCQVSQPSATEREKAGQWGATLTHVVHTPHPANVARGDLLQGTLPDGGTSLRVLAATTNSRQTYVRLDCTRAEPETVEDES